MNMRLYCINMRQPPPARTETNCAWWPAARPASGAEAWWPASGAEARSSASQPELGGVTAAAASEAALAVSCCVAGTDIPGPAGVGGVAAAPADPAAGVDGGAEAVPAAAEPELPSRLLLPSAAAAREGAGVAVAAARGRRGASMASRKRVGSPGRWSRTPASSSARVPRPRIHARTRSAGGSPRGSTWYVTTARRVSCGGAGGGEA
jgi:hypothetical protein